MDTEVLIVGAGPTGLMLANQLARNGVRALIIDRHAGPALQTRALGVQARTLEIYAHLGIVPRALELGKPGRGANLWADGRKMAHVPLGDSGRTLTPYPYILVLGQDDNERIMGDKLRDQGMTVQWNTELAALEQETGQVVATLNSSDGTARKITAAWVAGCDGAHSAVRHLSGIAFPGAAYEHVFFVADTAVKRMAGGGGRRTGRRHAEGHLLSIAHGQRQQRHPVAQFGLEPRAVGLARGRPPQIARFGRIVGQVVALGGVVGRPVPDQMMGGRDPGPPLDVALVADLLKYGLWRRTVEPPCQQVHHGSAKKPRLVRTARQIDQGRRQVHVAHRRARPPGQQAGHAHDERHLGMGRV